MTMLRSCCLLLSGIAGQAATPSTIENGTIRLEFDSTTAVLHIRDKASGESWDLGAPQIVLRDRRVVAAIPKSDDVSTTATAIRFTVFRNSGVEPGIEFAIDLLDSPPAVRYSFTGGFVTMVGPEIQEIELLHDALSVASGPENYYAIPHRLGVLLEPGSEKGFSRRYLSYQTGYTGSLGEPQYGYSMAMFGAVKNGSAMLVSWEDVNADLLVSASGGPACRLSAGLTMRNSARSATLRPLGRGGYVEIARAYRAVAAKRGLLTPLGERVSRKPSVAQLFGAADIKPFTLVRWKSGTSGNKGTEDKLDLKFTFAEAADLAAHLKTDLGLDRAMLVLAGWIRSGYDNQHPDILPAAAELGGNDALAECSRRIRQQGWLFGLHDNYQDIYRDSPSWNAEWIMKNADGSLQKGGVWAGGQCYLICSRKSLELAERNLPQVKSLFAPNIYFIDTVFAAPAFVCFDPRHPLTIEDDVFHKRKLSEYAQEQFGLFGSEEGREWGVPYADYFEGILSHKTGSHKDAADPVVPLFEMVYGDAIPMYTHQGDRTAPDRPEYVLDHILYAEMPVYELGEHRYWNSSNGGYRPPENSEAKLIFAGGSGDNRLDRFIRNTYEVLSPLSRLTSLLPMTNHRFLTPARTVESTRFGDDVNITVNYGPDDYVSGAVVLPRWGFVVESPSMIAFYARAYAGQRYSDPPLCVIRSLDGKPLPSSRQIRFYRGFGDTQIHWGGMVVEPGREKIVTR